MRYYPINLDLQNKKVLVVGAGPVALQKIEGLLFARANVHVVAEKVSEPVQHLANDGKLSLEIKRYQKEDLEGIVLVFAATQDPDVNRLIHADAQSQKIWVNAVDQPSECDFTIPARVHRGDLLLTISSGGKAPFLSKLLRKYFEKNFSPDWDEIVVKLASLREKMIQLGRGKEFASYMDEHAQEIIEHLMGADCKEFVERLKTSLGV